MNSSAKREFSVILPAALSFGVCLSVFGEDPAAISKGKEAELLKKVKVPAEFEAKLFAAPPLVNYPVFVAAAPNGALFVSADGNASLGRDPKRGSIVRLRDTDGDGHADETKKFVDDLDSPRGLVWDHDRLFVVHPPHLSVFIDKNGDGISDEQKVLVKNLAFTFKDRPADHTTNGLSVGVDGWLYIAGGDFGFMEAEGTDGRKLQLRGGGVIRVRPDGSGLELWSRGTRNIMEVAVSPLLDGFTRDNTNDGGGWDIRFHHFSGFEDHGYPRLYMNFGEEVVQPLGDYGGGSGCGAAWVDEPGFPAKWNNSPYTSDWGKEPVYKHTIAAKGATFSEPESPIDFCRVPRSTDLDVDANSAAYVSSWMGASFNWAGPDVGFIVKVSPKGYAAPALPDFEKLSSTELTKILAEDASHRRRLAAQSALLRHWQADAAAGLASVAKNDSLKIENRVAALFTLALAEKEKAPLADLLKSEAIKPWVLRAMGELQPSASLALGELGNANALVRKEALISFARAHGLSGVAADGATPTGQKVKMEGLADALPKLIPTLSDSDLIVAHTAMQVLRQLSATQACFTVWDKSGFTAEHQAALRVLKAIYDEPTVSGLISRLNQEKDPARRQGLLTALCRLYFKEGPWKGDSWGTRPDTRGPLYQPEKWALTPQIETVLKAAIAAASTDEARHLASEFARHRIKLDDATGRLIELANKDATLIPALATQLSKSDELPSAAVPLLIKACSDTAMPDLAIAEAVECLARSEAKEAHAAMLQGLAQLSDGRRQSLSQARAAVFNSAKIENQHQYFEQEAAKVAGPTSAWADAILLKLAARKLGAPEPREEAKKALESGWNEPKRRAQILQAILWAEDRSWDAKVIEALADSDANIAKTAEKIVKRFKIDPEKVKAESQPSGPLIASLQGDEILEQVMKVKGDVVRGEQVFTQAGCVACHTVKASEPLRGPFLGNIATIYKRRELAEAIINPSKTLAQGFTTNFFTLKDNTVIVGFVTQEAAAEVKVRDVAGQEKTIPVADIAKREKQEISLMPPGLLSPFTVKDLAGLVSYLEGLAAEKK